MRGAVYVDELVTLAPGRADDFLELLAEEGWDAIQGLDLQLVGAYRVAMMSDTEAIVIWAIPDWATWVVYERAHEDGGALRAWRDAVVAFDAWFTASSWSTCPSRRCAPGASRWRATVCPSPTSAERRGPALGCVSGRRARRRSGGSPRAACLVGCPDLAVLLRVPFGR